MVRLHLMKVIFERFEVFSHAVIIPSYIILLEYISGRIIPPHLRLRHELCLPHLRDLFNVKETGPRLCGWFIWIKGVDILRFIILFEVVL
jgi:hypothetical protein